MTETDVCPNCNMRRYENEAFCWWCNEDLRKYDPKCPTCGQAVEERTTEHIREKPVT